MLFRLFVLFLISSICNASTDILEPGSMYFIMNQNKRLAIDTSKGTIPIYNSNETILSKPYYGSFFMADKNKRHNPLVAECIFDGTIVIYLKDGNNILYLKAYGEGPLLNSVFSDSISELSIYDKQRKIIWFSGGSRSFYSWFWYSLNMNTASSSIEWYDKGKYRDHQTWTFEKIQNDHPYFTTEIFNFSSVINLIAKDIHDKGHSNFYPIGYASKIIRPRLHIIPDISLELQLLIEDADNGSSVITLNPSNENKTFIRIDEGENTGDSCTLKISFGDKQNATLIQRSHSEEYDQRFWFLTCKFGYFWFTTDSNGILTFIKAGSLEKGLELSALYFISLCKGYGDEYYIRLLDSNTNYIEMLHPNRSSLLVYHNGKRKYIASDDSGKLVFAEFLNDSSSFVSHGNGKFSCTATKTIHDIYWKMDGSSDLIPRNK